jgi:cytochrome c peroxidase
MFSDFEVHVLGVAEANGLTTPDTGNGDFAFRTPSLRQLAFTAPYFHGGQETNLRDAVDFYDNNNSDNPNVANNQLDPDFRNIPNLNNNEINAIVAFLNSLSDGSFDRTRPASVPSGLNVGGSID